NGSAGFPMPREKIEGLALPTPVLHDLRRQLDEIPCHAGSRKTPHFYATQQMMQQVPEFVKDSLGFAVREQRRFPIHRRRQVSANQPQVRTALARVAG